MVVFTYQRVCMCVLFTCVFIGSSVSHISLLKGGTTYREQCFPEFYTYLFVFVSLFLDYTVFCVSVCSPPAQISVSCSELGNQLHLSGSHYRSFEPI